MLFYVRFWGCFPMQPAGLKRKSGMHECIPYAQTNVFTIVRTWLIIVTGERIDPYLRTSLFVFHKEKS